jgi:2'-5' RNA ligase
MGSYTIVAIPSEDDYVWKLSSEKVPHMTILFLGEELQNEQNTMEFIQHVVNTTLCRFGMNVSRRGTLGPKDADVLFFDTRYAKQIENFRANLLKNSNIFQAYNSVEQYPEWTPHLTMGYPESPAKPDERDYPGIHWVNFDKIAIWVNDYEGPEFVLDESNYDSPLAYSDMGFDDMLSHFGIKGMHWGVRKDVVSASKDINKAVTGLRRDPTKTAHQQKVSQAGGLHRISDKDLEAMLKRMESERKFQKIMQEDANRRKEGMKVALHVLGQVGKIVLPIALGAVATKYGAGAASRAAYRTSAYVTRPVIEG